jgi:hypothetical protein
VHAKPSIVDATVDFDLNESTFSLQNGADDIAFAVNNLVERLTDGGHDLVTSVAGEQAILEGVVSFSRSRDDNGLAADGQIAMCELNYSIIN